jgi:PAS domain-containing protein
MKKRFSVHMENLFNYPDGSEGWFELSIQPVPEGIFILSMDITERKMVEKKLHESEERYRLLLDNSLDAV